VAIVHSVSSNQVCAVMQDWSESSRDVDGSHCMTMTVSGGAHTVNGFNNESPGQDSYPIQGWIRWPRAAAGGAPATMTSPTNGSELTASTVNFQWTNGSGVQDYVLYVGTAPGQHDIANEDEGGNSLSATVTGLPTNGSTVYVRLWSKINGAL
jgi:hypothetical protein